MKIQFLHLDWGLKAADPVTRIGFNRYPNCVIGIYAYVKGRGIGLRWRRPS